MKLLLFMLISGILIIAFLFVLWLIISRKVKQQIRQADRRRNDSRAMICGTSRFRMDLSNYNYEGEIPPNNYLGEPSCRFNAHSPYIRCAVNPMGPCEDCPSYEPKKKEKS